MQESLRTRRYTGGRGLWQFFVSCSSSLVYRSFPGKDQGLILERRLNPKTHGQHANSSSDCCTLNQPTSTDFSHPGHREWDVQISKHATHDTQAQVNPYNRSGIRRRAMTFQMPHMYSVITTNRRFVETEWVYLSICKLNTIFCSNISAKTTFHIMDSGTSPWETSSVLKTIGDHLEKYQFTPKAEIKTFNLSASGTKMQI